MLTTQYTRMASDSISAHVVDCCVCLTSPGDAFMRLPSLAIFDENMCYIAPVLAGYIVSSNQPWLQELGYLGSRAIYSIYPAGARSVPAGPKG